MKHSNHANEQIAIIGMGCHLPGGVASPDDLWKLLLNKTDAIIEVPSNRWDKRLFYDPDRKKPGKTYVVQGGFLQEDITLFDSMFFGISPREAPNIDPQQRMLLEVTYEAIEDAGLQLETMKGKDIGVFIGGFFLDFFLMQFNTLNRDSINMHTATGFSLGNLSNRISYTFDFRGPSLTIDTACSSSLVAFHNACQSIWNNESSLAIVGGVHIMLRPESFISVSKGSLLSTHGRCKTFDIEAGGYSRGEGAASIILKPYSKALADGDPIYALVRGTGVNQDGHTPAITFPSAESQEALIRQVYKSAGINPSDIHYAEAHGTGTKAGDPVELKALNAVLSESNKTEKTLVGSIKSNIGHMEAVAGVGGLMKAALCLKHKMVPPNIHFNTPNPDLNYDQLCLKVPTEVEELPKDQLSFASINSFGFGGTNAHAVLQEVPPQDIIDLEAPKEELPLYVLPLSARSEDALTDLATSYKDFLSNKTHSIEDIIYTASKRRTHHDLRLGIVAESTDKMINLLESFGNGEMIKGIVSNLADIKNPPKIAFIYTGMGPQWWKMGHELMESEPLFREELEKCDTIFKKHSGWSILDEMLKDEKSSRMAETQVAQPANFLIQVALTELLKKFGIIPQGIVGHSVGEVTAMYCSGALSLEDAILVSYHRSRLQQTTAGQGKMLAVGLSELETLDLLVLYPNVSIAAINSPNSVTIAGKEEQLLEIARVLDDRQIFNRLMKVEVPYHSYLMDPLEQDLINCLKPLNPNKEKVPVYSTVTGNRIDGETLTASYWWNNVRQPVRFAKTFNKMTEDGYTLFLEVGPHPVLKAFIKECLQTTGSKGISLQTLNRKEPELLTFYEVIAHCYTLGINIDWTPFSKGGKHIQLPRYPWQHEKYAFNESDLSKEDRLGLEGHPFCNKKMPTPHLAYEAELNQYLFPFLKDHRVENIVVFPGAGYVEGALALFNIENNDSSACCLENLIFHNMLAINDEEVQSLHLSVDQKSRNFGIYSRTKNGTNWIQHASGRILAEPLLAQRNSLMPVSNLKDTCLENLSVEQFYKDLDRLGLQYFPHFRTVKEIYRGEGTIVAKIEGHEYLADTDKYFLHPTILDGAIQTLAALFDKLVIPSKIGQVNFYGSPGRSCWSYLKITQTTQVSITGNLYLIDENGCVYAELMDLECQRVPKDDSWKDQILDSWIYDVLWEASDEPKTSSTNPYWLIFAKNCSETKQIIDDLKYRGQEYKLIEIDDNYANINDYETILHSIGNISENSDVHILYIADSPTKQHIDNINVSSATDVSLPVVYMVQAWEKTYGEANLKIDIVTHNAQFVGDEPIYNLTSGSLLAMNRLINNEHLNITCKNIDLGYNMHDSMISLLVDEMLSDNSDDDVAYRSGIRYVKRLVHTATDNGTTKTSKKEVLADVIPVELTVGEIGKPESLFFREVLRSEPGYGQIEFKVYGCSINDQDAAEVMGRIPPRMVTAPETKQILGIECHGTITKMGAGVTGFSVGDEVIACVKCGSIKSFITVDANDYIMHKPKCINSGDVSSIAPFMLAVHAFESIAHIQKGSKVLIHNAASMVGLASVQVAQWKKAEIYTTAVTNEQIEYLKSLGINHVMDLNSFDFVDTILKLTNYQGVDVIISNVSGEKRAQSLKLLAPYGSYIQIGKNDTTDEIRLPAIVFNKNITVAVNDIESLCQNKKLGIKLWKQIEEGFQEGYFSSLPVESFDAQDVAKCFTAAFQSENIGGIQLKISGSKLQLQVESNKELLKSNSTYIVTGGTKGLGLEIGKWLAANGAKYIVLISRSGAVSSESKEAIAQMEKSGVKVIAPGIDVANYNDMIKLIQDVSSSTPPVRGIFHGAMVLDDGFIVDMNKDRYQNVMTPKVAGAINLHLATLNQPLDFFISFSSIASLIGNTGQVNYVAANSFLEAFAYYRRSTGLTATTVNLGVLGDVGVTSRNSDVLSLLEQSGIGSMTVEQVLYSLGIIIDRKPVQAGLFKVDWKMWSQKNPGTAKSSRYKKLVSADIAGNTIPEHLRKHLEALLDLDGDSRIAYVESLLVKELAAVLRLPVDKINKKRPIMELGVDSLMTVELRSRLSELFVVPLSNTLFFNYPTIEKMAEYFIKNVIKFDGIQTDSSSEEDAVESDVLKDFEALLNRVTE